MCSMAYTSSNIDTNRFSDIAGVNNIEVIKSKRRSIGLEVYTDGHVIVRIPSRLSKRQLEEFVINHKEWISEKRQYMLTKEDNRISTKAKSYDNLTIDEQKDIKYKFVEKVNYYSSIMNVSVGRITIRNQKTRWGSCSSRGNLNFNYQLYYMPEELMDYVIIHELSHRKYMNHSSEFWMEVEKYCPDYKIRRNKLKLYKLET